MQHNSLVEAKTPIDRAPTLQGVEKMIIHADKFAKWFSADCTNVAWFLNTIPALKIAAMN